MRRALVCLALLLTACLPAEIVRTSKEPLTPALTFLEGGGGNSVVLVRAGRALVFDPKMWPYGDEVLGTLREAGARATFVVDSHLHFDHTGENGLYPRAVLVGAASTLAFLATDRLGPRALPFGGAAWMPVERRLTVDVGGEPVVLVHPAPAHTDGDVYAWFPDERVLATGDLFTAGFYPHVDPLHGGSMLGLVRALDELCAFDATTVIPGHGPATGRAALVAYRDFLRALVGEIRERRAKGENDEAIVAAMKAPRGEPYADLGLFSSREDVVRRLVAETALSAPASPTAR